MRKPTPEPPARAAPVDPSARTRLEASLETHFRTDGFAIFSWRNLLIVVWTTASTVPLVDELERQSARFHRTHPGGVSVVHIIAKGPPLPDPAVRERFGGLLGRNPKTLACVGVVLEGRGFWASALRSFLVGLRVFSPRSVQMHAASTTRELAAWIIAPHSAKTTVALDAAELERVLDRARESVDAGARASPSP